MRWNKPLWWPFNIGLLLWQLAFVVIGKTYSYFFKVEALQIFRKKTWAQLWQSIFYCHVRLVIGPRYENNFRVISFTAPSAKFEDWTNDMIDRSHPLRECKFDVDNNLLNDEALKIIGSQTARRYDYLQLLSFIINLIVWIFAPGTWGKQIVAVFDSPKKQVCSSGVVYLIHKVGFHILFGYHVSMTSPALLAISSWWED
jgi:hypothetical protein